MVGTFVPLLGWVNWRMAVGKNSMTIGYIIVFAIIAYSLNYGIDYIVQKKKKEKEKK